VGSIVVAPGWAWVMAASEKSAAVRVCRIRLMDIWIDFTSRAGAETGELHRPGGGAGEECGTDTNVAVMRWIL
jgi:hypothetical protein